MQPVYNECTCCFRLLTEEELKKNKRYENFYYTICDDCVEKFTNRIFQILNEE